MSIRTKLQTERGEAVETVVDRSNVLQRILPGMGDPKYQCLSVIDWYGDTLFNYLQAPRFLAEWQILEAQAQDAEAVRVLREIRELAERVQSSRHLYLRFVGD